MDPAERLERLERTLAQLAEDSLEAPVLVEGTRDEAALRALGVEGEIIVYNQGRPMIELADRLRDRPRVVVLFDWDRKGGQLTRLLRGLMGGAVDLDVATRRELAVVSLVKCVEDLPHARRNLRARLGKPGREDGG